jgi:hypothetical protein
MGGLLYTGDPNGLTSFIIITLILGGAGAVATGRAFAGTWRPFWGMVPPVIFLAAAVRFLHYALFGEDITSLQYYVVALIVVALAAAYGYRSRRVVQMTRQYPWLFAKSGVLAWSVKTPG